MAAIAALKDSGRPDRFAAVCDLLTWDSEHLQRLKDAFARTGAELEKALVVPAVGPECETSWYPLADVFVWDEGNLEVMDAREIAKRADIPIVLPGLGTERTRRLKELHQSCLGHGMDPSHETIANWAEAVAKHLQGRAFDPNRWNAYYRDLDRMFPNASALRGRRILIDSRERLLPAGPWDQETSGESTTAVFFAPRRRAETRSIRG